MPNVTQIVNGTKDWYFGMFFPPLASPGFGRFASQSLSLVSAVSGKSDIRVRVEHVGAAYVMAPATFEGKSRHYTITIPRWYFDPRSFEDYKPPKIWSVLAIAMINGSLAHEARHIRYSSLNLLDHIKKSAKLQKLFNEVPTLCVKALNLVEDLFIESVDQLAPEMRFVAAKNSILFRQPVMVDYYSKEIAMSRPSGIDMVGLLCFLKNRDLVEDALWSNPDLAKYVEVLEKARNPTLSLVGRADVAAELVEMLTKDPEVTITPADKEDPTSSKTDGYDKDPSKGKSTLPEPIKKAIGEDDDDMERKGGVSKSVDEFMEEGDAKEVWEFALVQHVYDVLSAPRECFDRRESGIVWHSDEGVNELAETLKFRSKKTRPSVPKLEGVEFLVDRLAMAKADRRIFSDVTERGLEPPETVVLIDLSGSTRGGVSDTPNGELLMEEVNAGRELDIALSGYPHSVCGFTSARLRTGSRDEAVFFVTTSYQMSQPDTAEFERDERFEKLGCVDATENYDGLAIAEATNLFTVRNRKKVLIVLSDGAPCGGGYHGSEAMGHTQRAIADARAKGILVCALSLTDSASEANAKIYGPQFNLSTTAGDIGEKVKDIIESVLATIH